MTVQKFIPKEKLSKKARQALNARQRQTWGGFSPVTRKPQNPKRIQEKSLRA